MTHEPVKNYYAGFGEREWDRLKSPNDGFVEYAVTRKMLSKYLKPKSRILDIGGTGSSTHPKARRAGRTVSPSPR